MRPIAVGYADSKEFSSDLFSESLKLGKKMNVWALKSKITGKHGLFIYLFTYSLSVWSEV